MVNSCSAYGCKNRNAKGSTITFHRFPLNNKSLLKLWLYQIKRGNWEPSKYSVICSEHFTEDCFVVKGLQNSRRTLKSDAYPTIFSMAIYSEPPKKKTFPGRKTTDDVSMVEETKEENGDAPEKMDESLPEANEKDTSVGNDEKTPEAEADKEVSAEAGKTETGEDADKVETPTTADENADQN